MTDPTRFTALVERLESRTLLSGSITAAISNGLLDICGDHESNQIIVTTNGLEPGQVRLTGLNGTLVNNAAEVILNGLSQGVRAAMGGGDDVLRLSGVSVSGEMTFIDAEGWSVLDISGCSAGGGMTITGGDGEYILSDSNVAGSLLLRLTAEVQAGFSADQVQLGRVQSYVYGGGLIEFAMTEAQIAQEVYFFGGMSSGGVLDARIAAAEIGGWFQLENAEGDETIRFENTRIAETITVSTGQNHASVHELHVIDSRAGGIAVERHSGASLTVLSSSSMHRLGSVKVINHNGSSHAFVAEGVRLGGLYVQNVGAETSFELHGFVTGGIAYISDTLGQGIAEVVLADSQVSGGIYMSLSDAVVELQIAGSDSPSAIGGNVSINTTAYLKGGIQGVDIGGNLKIDASKARLDLSLSSVSALNTQIKSGGMDDTVTLTDVLAGRKLTVNTGGGDDVVTLDQAAAMRLTSINTGAGNDTIFLVEPDPQGVEALPAKPAKMKINAGSGDDRVEIRLDGGGVFGMPSTMKLTGGKGFDTLDVTAPYELEIGVSFEAYTCQVLPPL